MGENSSETQKQSNDDYKLQLRKEFTNLVEQIELDTNKHLEVLKRETDKVLKNASIENWANYSKQVENVFIDIREKAKQSVIAATSKIHPSTSNEQLNKLFDGILTKIQEITDNAQQEIFTLIFDLVPTVNIDKTRETVEKSMIDVRNDTEQTIKTTSRVIEKAISEFNPDRK